MCRDRGDCRGSRARNPRGQPSFISKVYQIYEDADRPGRFVTVECWRDQQAFDKHVASPHVAAALTAAGPLLAEPPAIQPHRRLP